MLNHPLPNEEEIKSVGNLQESHDQSGFQKLREDPVGTSTTLTIEQEKTTEYMLSSSSEASDTESAAPTHATEQETKESVTDEEKPPDYDKQIAEQPLVSEKQEQQQSVPTMSPEQVLLLQVLRRAKRQQDLIIEVQRNLKLLTYVQKEIEKTREQVKQLQSAAKDYQKQFMQIERQLLVIQRGQNKGFEKLRTRKIGAELPSNKGKGAKSRRIQKKSK